MKRTVNWGIIGLGRIAHKFAHDMQLSQSTHLYAVASRDMATAEEFQRTYGAEKAYGSYQQLLEDPAVEVIYIATPHHLHYPLILQCLAHGKSVLCEKPFCVNATQVRKVMKRQQEAGLFVMEAMWTKFIPAYHELGKLLDDDAFRPFSLYADLGFPAEYNPAGRLFNPELAGGSLLDCGIYPLFLALDLMGAPKKLSATGHQKNGVDIRMSAMLHYSEGRTAQIHSDFETMTSMEAVIHTKKGVFSLPARWIDMDRFYLRNRENIRTYKYPKTGIGYFHELEHVNECISAGIYQSPVYPLSKTLLLAEQMDFIRSEIGVRYSDEIEMARDLI